MNLLLHPETRDALERFLTKPGHGLLITAPIGSGKASVARLVTARLLAVPPEKVEAHPYVKVIRPEEGKSIPVEHIREAIHFTTLRSSTKTDVISRVIVIEESNLMTPQAQNALLKTIEEPPQGTVIILTAPSERSVLPTIRSRVQHIILYPTAFEDVMAHFQHEGYQPAAIQKALLMSGGLPGLLHALLAADAEHPLFAATATAREILQKPLFDRLVLAETLAKERLLLSNTLFILAQMARTALQQGNGNTQTIRRWERVLRAAYDAESRLTRNAQAKLVLLDFMLTL